MKASNFNRKARRQSSRSDDRREEEERPVDGGTRSNGACAHPDDTGSENGSSKTNGRHPSEDGGQAEELKSFRTPNHIPDETLTLIKERHGPGTTRPTYFLETIVLAVLRTMVLETCQSPDTYHLDPRTTKKIYKYKKFDRPIGTNAISGEDCYWLLVIAKRNSWITAAYPLNNPNYVKES